MAPNGMGIQKHGVWARLKEKILDLLKIGCDPVSTQVIAKLPNPFNPIDLSKWTCDGKPGIAILGF